MFCMVCKKETGLKPTPEHIEMVIVKHEGPCGHYLAGDAFLDRAGNVNWMVMAASQESFADAERKYNLAMARFLRKVVEVLPPEATVGEVLTSPQLNSLRWEAMDEVEEEDKLE